MKKNLKYQVGLVCFIFLFIISQLCVGFNTSVLAATNGTTLQQQVATQLPISTAAYTQESGADPNWVAVDRYLSDLKPTTSYVNTVAQNVYQTNVAGDTYIDTYPQSVTEIEKTIMGWTASGYDATNVNGVNLLDKLDQLTPNDIGTNGDTAVIFALIALDSKPYQLSTQALTTRDTLIQELLDSKLPHGGWGYLTMNQGIWGSAIYDASWNVIGYNPPSDNDFSTDVTGMAISALAPYYQSNPSVKNALDQAVTALKAKGDTSNTSSLAQLIVGLTAMKQDPTTFNNTNLVEKLLSLKTYDGLFRYDVNTSNPDPFSTHDAIVAMASYLKFVQDNGHYSSVYYQMNGPGTQSDPIVQQPDPNGGNGNTGSTDSGAGSTSTGSSQTNGKVTVSVTGYQGTILLPSTPIDLQANDNPYTVLVRAVGEGNVISSGNGASIYVKSIDGLSEFDKGPLSGWIYKVNGEATNVGAGSYSLHNGDNVQWVFTIDGGNDVGATDSGGSIAPTPPSSSITDAIQSLPVPVDNTKPIDQVGQSIFVLNKENPMTQEQAQTLADSLNHNYVNINQAVASDKDQVLTDGVHEIQLFVPKGAIPGPITIGIKEETATTDRKELVSPIYDFTPNGTHFEKPVDITIKVPLTVKDLNQIALVWLDESTNQWIPIPAVVNASTGEVTGEVNHFTKFAVIDKSQLQSSIPLDHAIQNASEYLLKSDPITDWTAFALSRAGQTVPESYISNVKKSLEQNHGILSNVTDYERLVFGVLSAKGDPLNVDGYNLIQSIYNNEHLTSQGINGVAFGLLALDSNQYQVPDNALWNQTKMIGWLLKNQNQDGGWALEAGDTSDLDLTSMVLAALAPYQSREDVNKAINAALQWIKHSNTQSVDNSESIAQEIQGLTALGQNPMDDTYNRDGKNLIENLLQYQQLDGGFVHEQGQPVNTMATEQALAALVSYKYYMNGQGSIYQFSTQPNTEYIDIADISDWALGSVNKARVYGFMNGVSQQPPMFAPKREATRAEFTKVILSLLGTQPSTTGGLSFQDVPQNAWYYGYIKAATDIGVIKGVSTQSFAPDQPITREQAAVIIANAWHLQPLHASFPVTDRKAIDSYAYNAMQALYDHGIMVGDGKRIDPHGLVTREAIAVLAVKVYEQFQNEK